MLHRIDFSGGIGGGVTRADSQPARGHLPGSRGAGVVNAVNGR
jgi:hypothetical protein